MKTSAYWVSAKELQLVIGPAMIHLAGSMAEPLADAIEIALQGEWRDGIVQGEAFGKAREVFVFPPSSGRTSIGLNSGDMHLKVPAATARRAVKELHYAIEHAPQPKPAAEVRLADHPESVEGVVSLETFFAQCDSVPLCLIEPGHPAHHEHQDAA